MNISIKAVTKGMDAVQDSFIEVCIPPKTAGYGILIVGSKALLGILSNNAKTMTRNVLREKVFSAYFSRITEVRMASRVDKIGRACILSLYVARETPEAIYCMAWSVTVVGKNYIGIKKEAGKGVSLIPTGVYIPMAVIHSNVRPVSFAFKEGRFYDNGICTLRGNNFKWR